MLEQNIRFKKAAWVLPNRLNIRLAQWTLYGVFFYFCKTSPANGKGALDLEFGMVSAIRFSRKLWVVVILRDLELQ